MSIWHSRGHTHRNARIHIVAYTGSARSDHSSTTRGSLGFISARLSLSRVVVHCLPFSNPVFTPTCSAGGLQRPRKHASVQHWSPYKENTFRQASRGVGPLSLLCRRETALFDIFGERSICVAFHVTRVLFVIRRLTRCESATD